MKRVLLGLLVSMSFMLNGCATMFSFGPDPLVYDKHYIPKQCPLYTHEIAIPAKKYEDLYVCTHCEESVLVMKLSDLLFTLETNTEARENFNEMIMRTNKTTVVRDESDSENREVKKIFVDRVCPIYTHEPEFKVRKLTATFIPEYDESYVVVPLLTMTERIEQQKLATGMYNTAVNRLNNRM